MTELASGKKKKVKTTGPVEVVKEKDRSLKKEKKSKKTKVVAEQNQLDAKEEDLLLEELHDGRYPTSDEILDQMEQVPALHPPDVEAALNHEDLDQGSADPEAVSIKADDTKSKSASKKKKSSSKGKAEGMAVANDAEKIFKPSPSSAPAAATVAVARKSKKKPAASPDAAANTSNADVPSAKSATSAHRPNAEAKETAETGEPAPPKKKNKQKKLKWAMVTISPADYQLRAIRAYENADEGQKKRICEINEKKYHMIRFFERKRIERNLEKARKNVMRMLKEQNVEGETKAREALAKVEADKKYVTKFPFFIPYLALYPNTDSPESEARRQYMREYIDKMVADKRAKFEDEEDKYLAAKADEKSGKGKGKGSKGKGKKGSGKGVQKGSEKKGKGKGAKGKGGKNDDSEKGSDDAEKAGVAAEQDKEGVVVEEADGEAKPRKSEKKAKKQKKEAPSSSAAVAGVDAATEPAAKKEKMAKSKKRSAHDEAGEGATKGSAAKQGTEKAEKPTKVQRVDGDKKAAKQKQENGTHASFLASQAPHRQGAIVAANNTKKTFDDSDSD